MGTYLETSDEEGMEMKNNKEWTTNKSSPFAVKEKRKSIGKKHHTPLLNIFLFLASVFFTFHIVVDLLRYTF